VSGDNRRPGGGSQPKAGSTLNACSKRLWLLEILQKSISTMTGEVSTSYAHHSGITWTVIQLNDRFAQRGHIH
jgi:hypothetical protein